MIVEKRVKSLCKAAKGSKAHKVKKLRKKKTANGSKAKKPMHKESFDIIYEKYMNWSHELLSK